MIAIGVRQLPGLRQALQLLAQDAPLLASAEAQLADQLLVSGARAGQPLDVAQQFAVGHARI